VTSDDAPAVGPGARVVLHFELSLPDGTSALSTFGEDPVEIAWGDGTLCPGMELALLGLHAGDEQTLTLTPGQAFGLRDPSLVQRMPMSDFPPDLRPEAGQIIAFTVPNGEETAGAVLAIDGDEVEVDFNHPLAGMDVTFRVKVLAVEQSAARP
jgi:FKBP-type peptidyl-prolyl cis-trans isomerase SlpA